MKKRTIITIIATIFIAIVTNKMWLLFKPMSVDFDIHGKGQCYIEVQLNKKDNDKFTKIRSQRIFIDLNTYKHVSFSVKRAKFPKRLKLIFTDLNGDAPIEISNLSLKNGKYKLDDLGQFYSSSEKIVVKDNSIIVYPNNNSVNLEYKKKLNARASIKFDFKLLVIILVLSYLITYKLLNYVADFKTVKNKSRIDIIFLIIFFVFLFIPMSHMEKDDISQEENRTLAKFQPFITQEGEINYDFGANFQDWFNDRFYLRKKIIPLYHKLMYSIASDYVQIPLGYAYKKSGWMFYNQSQGDTNNSFAPFSSEELQMCKRNIAKLWSYCKKNNIKLYILISPTKEYLYRQEDYVNLPEVAEKTEALVDVVDKELNFKIIYPKNELKELKRKEYVCYKTDHHLTDSASFFVYQILLKRIKQDFKDLPIKKESDFNISYNNLTRWEANRVYTEGCNYERADMSDKNLLKTKYKFYDYKKLNEITITGKRSYYLHENPRGKYKLFIIGNSYCENLVYFLNTSFRRIDKFRFNLDLDFPKRNNLLDINAYEPYIEKQKPDILLLVLSSGYVDYLKYLYQN